MKIKLIVWDFDGTLIDSRPQIEAGMDHALGILELGPEIREEWLKYVGLPVRDGIEGTFGPLGMTFDEVYPVYRSFDWHGSDDLIRPFPGMTELLAELHAAGVKMAIASSKRGEALRRQAGLFGWEPYFDPIITPDEVGEATKPHPESLDQILAIHGVRPDEALMVGDTPFDLDMAQRAGVPSVAVTHGFYGREALEAWGPVGCADDTAGLRAILLPRVLG